MSRGLGKTIGRFLLDQRNAFRRLFGRDALNNAYRDAVNELEGENHSLTNEVAALREENHRLQRERLSFGGVTLHNAVTGSGMIQVPNDYNFRQGIAQAQQVDEQAQAWLMQSQQQVDSAYQNNSQSLVESALYAPSLWPEVNTRGVGTNPNRHRPNPQASRFHDTEEEDL